jgi:hypothetical protein
LGFVCFGLGVDVAVDVQVLGLADAAVGERVERGHGDSFLPATMFTCLHVVVFTVLPVYMLLRLRAHSVTCLHGNMFT